MRSMGSKDRLKKPELPASDDELEAALRRMFRSEFAPPLDESVVEAYLSLPKPHSKEEIDSMFTPQIRERLGGSHEEPVRKIKQKLTLELWLKKTRESVQLSIYDIAQALGKDPDFVEQLEASKILPWKLRSSDAADIAILFNVHDIAFTRMAKFSYTVNEARKLLKKGKNARKAAEPYEKDLSAKMGFDIHFANIAKGVELSDEIKGWLKAFRDELKRRGATHLLKK
jgi:hypothetical protein